MDAVTATVGVLCLVGALLIATVGRMQWPRVTVALVLTGSAGLLQSTIGGFINDAATRVDAMAGGFIGRWTGEAVTGLIGVVVVGVAALWIWQRKIDMRTLGVTALVPPTVALIPGTFGSIAVAVVGVVPMLLAYLISALFGLG